MVQHQPGFGPPVGPAIGGVRRCGPRMRAIGLVYREGDGRDDDPIPKTIKLRIVLLKNTGKSQSRSTWDFDFPVTAKGFQKARAGAEGSFQSFLNYKHTSLIASSASSREIENT